jgi:hypothetical protein
MKAGVTPLGRMAVLGILLGVAFGCEQPSAPPQDDSFVPFEGAEVVKPNQAEKDLPVEEFIVSQLKQYAAQVPPSLHVGPPQVLWLEGEPPRRKGVAIVPLVRGEIYCQSHEFKLEGPAEKVLTDLMKTAGGHVVNLHRIPPGTPVRIDLPAGSLAQAVYAGLKSAGLSGRILNANRWVLGSFQEGESPVEAFRPMFDQLWEACDSLRASQPVLSVLAAGEQVLSEDDIRLRRQIQRAGQKVDWPTYAGSAPDPGLLYGPSGR